MANVIRGNDTVRGTDVTITVEENGIRHDFIHAKNFESKVELNKDDVPRIGTRVVGEKNGTVTYSGSATVYYCDPVCRRLVINYIKTGEWPDITITVRNYDKDTRAGAQTTIHKGVKFDDMTLAKFDAESTILDEEINFTFEEVAIPEEFTELPGTIL